MSNTTNIDPAVEKYLKPLGPGEEISPEHRSWMDAQIRERMGKKARGEANYTPLEEVRVKLGL